VAAAAAVQEKGYWNVPDVVVPAVVALRIRYYRLTAKKISLSPTQEECHHNYT